MSNYYDDATVGGWSLNGTGWNVMSALIQSAVQPTVVTTLTNKTLTAPTIATIVNSGTLTLPTATDTIVGRTTTDTLTNKTLTNPALGNSNITGIKQATFNGVYDVGNSGTAATVNWTNGSIQKVTLTGNAALTFVAPSGASRCSLLLLQDTVGTRTVTWPTVKWAGAVAPTLTTTTSRTDIVTFLYDGTSYYGSASLNFN
jgi:hypothetical protein